MATPNLGYGTRGEAPINAVNQYMRGSDWYQSLIKSFGQDPNNVHLTDGQKQQVIRAAQAHGIVVDEGGNGQEVDESGNFRAKGHKLKNTLIVAGIAGAALATMGAASVFAGGAGAAGAGAGATGAGVGIGETGATLGLAGSGFGAAAGAGSGASLGLASAASAAGAKGLSYADLLKYGAPVAGNLVGGIIQANAEGKASAAQQKYLEEALAYEKEKDTYQRGIDKEAVAREEGRYSGYQGRIAPFIANGTSSNNRMAELLGLPAGSGGSSNSSGSSMSGDPISYADRLSAADKLKVDAELKAANSSDNPLYWYGVNAQHGGFDATGADWNHTRISTGDGAGKGYSGPSTPAPSAPSTPAAAPPNASTVQMKGPDGSIRQVKQADVQHYLGLGAVLLQGAA